MKTSLIAIALMFAIAIGIGVGLWLSPRLLDPAKPQSDLAEVHVDSTGPRADNDFIAPPPLVLSSPQQPPFEVIQFTLVRQDDTRRVLSGILHRQREVVISALSPLDGAAGIFSQSADLFGHRPSVAVDPTRELAFIATGNRTSKDVVETPNLATDTPRLSLGSEFIYSAIDNRGSGKITNNLTQFVDGAFGFRLASPTLPADGIALLFDKNEKALLGIAVGARWPLPSTKAFDWYEVRNSVDNAFANNNAYAFDELQAKYFGTEISGRKIRFRNAATKGDDSYVLQVAYELWTGSVGQERDAIASAYRQAFDKQLRYHFARRNYETVVTMTEASTAIIGTDPTIATTHANALLNLNRVADAHSVVITALGDEPQNATLQQLLYDIFFQRFDSSNWSAQEQLIALNQAIALDNKQPDYFVARAQALAAQGRHFEAIEDFNRAIDLAPQLAGELNEFIAEQRYLVAPENNATVPVRRAGGVISAPVMVNGREFQFVIDTGASITAISSEVAAMLGLSISNTQRLNVATANGTIAAPLVQLNDIALGRASLGNLEAVVLSNFSRYDGLLGLNFLDNFQFEFDAAGDSISLSPR
ncbi:MAG: TIGR02281 family clan AA aspartic protease [Pseudomonadota bacterium]